MYVQKQVFKQVRDISVLIKLTTTRSFCFVCFFPQGKSEPVLNEMPITNAQVPSSTCCTGTLAIDVSSRAVVTGVRSNYQSPVSETSTTKLVY